MAVRIFIHGLDSSPAGKKGSYFKERFPDMLIPHFVGSLDQRMKLLGELLRDKNDIILVGSSLGGLMATLFAISSPSRCKKLILLAPAINLIQKEQLPEKPLIISTIIFHGRNDGVIPLDLVQSVATKIFANLSFYVVQDDHMLYNTFFQLEWYKLLEYEGHETKQASK